MIKVLRRPVEFALRAAVGVEDHLAGQLAAQDDRPA